MEPKIQVVSDFDAATKDQTVTAEFFRLIE